MKPLLETNLSRRQWAFDVLVAAGHLVFSVLLSGAQFRFEIRGSTWAFVGVVAVALGFRRAGPLASFAAVLLASTAFALTGYPLVVLGPAPLTSLYSLAAAGPLRRSLFGAGATACALLLVAASAAGGADLSTMSGNGLMLGIAWLLGDLARRRGQVAEAHRQRAAALERSEGQRAEQAVADERLRIARELHDVVAHSMSVIAVQAGTGRLAIDRDPAVAKQSLQVIEETTRQALDEMRRMLGLLRADDADAGERAPAPGLSDIDSLVADARRDGLDVTTLQELSGRRLPHAMEATVYRVIQEALNNVRRHAPGAAVTIDLGVGDDELRLRVINTEGLTALRTGGAGLGLIGIRERASVYGGTVDAGPTPDGGWAVNVRLPLRARRSA